MKKRGNRFGFWFFETVLKKSGLRPAYGFLYLVCIHYLLFDSEARSGGLAYIQRQVPTVGKFKQLQLVYFLFVSQGKNLLDRYVHSANDSIFTLKECGFEPLDELLKNPKQGFVLLTAHTGNWQIAMTVLKRFNRTVNLLMLPEENAAVEESLNIQGETGEVKIISVKGPMGGMVETMQALERGEIVSIMGDRSYGARSVSVDFIGDSAQFPCAAFMIAATARCPVVTLLSSKAETKTYHVDIADIFEPQWDRKVAKDIQLQQWTQRFATILENYLKKRPNQCFLFHDIWEKSS